MNEPLAEDEFRVPIVWVGADDAPIEFANAFAVTFQGDEAIVLVGAIAPPLLLGSADERRQQASRLSFVPVRVLARYGMPVSRMREWIGVLQGQLEAYEEAQKGSLKG